MSKVWIVTHQPGIIFDAKAVNSRHPSLCLLQLLHSSYLTYVGQGSFIRCLASHQHLRSMDNDTERWNSAGPASKFKQETHQIYYMLLLIHMMTQCWL